jgi:hypothetical protein
VTNQLFEFAATIPAGTLLAAPVTVPMLLPAGTVDQVDIHVPDGFNGFVGFALTSAGVNIFPSTPGSYFTTSNEVFSIPLVDHHTSGAWALTGYNLGNFSHTVRCRFYLTPAGSVTPTIAMAPINNAALSSA